MPERDVLILSSIIPAKFGGLRKAILGQLKFSNRGGGHDPLEAGRKLDTKIWRVILNAILQILNFSGCTANGRV